MTRKLIDSGIENDLKIVPKNLVRIPISTSGDSQGTTPWGSPGVQGLEIDDSGGRFGSIFDLQSIIFRSQIIFLNEIMPKLLNTTQQVQKMLKSKIFTLIDS